jgi:hypothetical protein
MARSSLRSSGAAALVTLLVLIAADPASAHRRDEYLQAARLAIDPDRVHIDLDLTPGIAVADAVLAEVDGDGDGSISDGEARAYAGRVLRAIAVDVDGAPLRVELVESTFPARAAIVNGEGTMRIGAVASIDGLTRGVHHLRFRNHHRPDISAYLANTLVPASDRVAVAAQRRDVTQRDLTIEYTLQGESSSTLAALAAGIVGAFVWLASMSWRGRRLRTEGHR